MKNSLKLLFYKFKSFNLFYKAQKTTQQKLCKIFNIVPEMMTDFENIALSF